MMDSQQSSRSDEETVLLPSDFEIAPPARAASPLGLIVGVLALILALAAGILAFISRPVPLPDEMQQQTSAAFDVLRADVDAINEATLELLPDVQDLQRHIAQLEASNTTLSNEVTTLRSDLELLSAALTPSPTLTSTVTPTPTPTPTVIARPDTVVVVGREGFANIRGSANTNEEELGRAAERTTLKIVAVEPDPVQDGVDGWFIVQLYNEDGSPIDGITFTNPQEIASEGYIAASAVRDGQIIYEQWAVPASEATAEVTEAAEETAEAEG